MTASRINESTGDRRRIVWAVNPFADEAGVMNTTLDAITEQTDAFEGEIIPVCVWRTTGDESALTAGNEHQERYWKEGRRVVSELLEKRGLRGQQLQILAGPYLTLRDGISDLLKFSRRQGADLIVVAGRGRKGPGRWLIGSFAEALSTHSDIPLLIVPPLARVSRHGGQVLFTTDFSQECFYAYQQLVQQARVYNWSITLYHHVVYYYPVFDYAFIPPPFYEQPTGGATAERQDDMISLVEYAQEYGVRARFHIENSMAGNTAEMILQYAEKGFDLIAMASRTGPIQGALLGSTVRRVIRESSLPVWVIHPHVDHSGEKDVPVSRMPRPDPTQPTFS